MKSPAQILAEAKELDADLDHALQAVAIAELSEITATLENIEATLAAADEKPRYIRAVR